ncbi:hypothetical protein [Psychroserpens algicola]|uniref:Uncharacterized protein n=1 Tax=Psychroserpens algicola TaxID=1719034 RepID=A0ABT0H6U1_9FLAO|nr:hypothetical protein [Psychroserpens algicola]MCK8479530.1 hypothetical protein [Psychroserpens algicola]
MSFITKLKTAFGNSKTNSATAISDTTDAIINDIEHQPFAISEHNVLYAGLNELGGYYFFQTVIVGTFKIKTKKGAQLSIHGETSTFSLESDSFELESDPIDIKGRSITKIDFQIEEQNVEKIHPKAIDQFSLSCDKQDIIFSVIHLNDEEE